MRVANEKTSGEDGGPVCPKAHYVSPAVRVNTVMERENWKLEFLTQKMEKCFELNSRIRFIAADRFYEYDTIADSIRIKGVNFKKILEYFIEIISLLKRLHSIGIVHGNIHSGAVRLLGSEKLSLVEFGSAKFFPIELNSNEKIPENIFDNRPPAQLSIFELQRYRAGRRDDLERAFVLTFNLLLNLQLDSIFEHIMSRKAIVIAFAQISCVRARLDEVLRGILSGEHIARCSCGKYTFYISIPAAAWTALHRLRVRLGEEKFTEFMDKLSAIAKYVRGEPVSGTESILNHPDSEPDYKWLITKTNEAIHILN